MKSEKFIMSVGFIAISLIWGSTWLAIKIGLESMPPFYGLAFRFSLAMVILFVLMKLRGQSFPADSTSIKLYVTLGVCSFSLPFGLVYWGEQYIPSGLAAVLFAIYPFVVAIYSHFFLPHEPMTIPKVWGISMGFFGIVLIFWSDIHIGEAATSGMIAIVTSTLLQAAALIVVKKLGKHISPIAMNFGGMLVGVPIMFLLAFLLDDASLIKFDEKGIGSFIYLGTFGTVVTFVIYYWLLKRVEAVYMSLIALVTPVLAVILGTIYLGEALSPKVFTGAGLVLLGILIANSKDLIETLRHHSRRIFSQEETE
jgi:drug/metabolite transporter (DMT)-like permease